MPIPTLEALLQAPITDEDVVGYLKVFSRMARAQLRVTDLNDISNEIEISFKPAQCTTRRGWFALTAGIKHIVGLIEQHEQQQK